MTGVKLDSGDGINDTSLKENHRRLGQRQHFYTFQVGIDQVRVCGPLLPMFGTCSSPRTYQALKEKLPLGRIEFPSLWPGMDVVGIECPNGI